jgi:pyruvate formate lyase activating enzyme
MHFGGFQPLTLTDYPGRTACIVFTQGCNLRCGYCHNPQLIGLWPPVGTKSPTEEQIFAFLKKREGLLDGIVVSGGEPTLQVDLLPFLRHVKTFGFVVKLDTNGTNPGILQAALSEGLVDYVAMDVKHDPRRYGEITDTGIDCGVLFASRDVLQSSHIAYEFRTTVVPEIHDTEAIRCIAQFCGVGARLVLQGFRPAGVLNPSFRNYSATSTTQLLQFQKIAEGQGCVAGTTSSSHVLLPHFHNKAGVF